MTLRLLLLIIISVGLSAGAQVALKSGADKVRALAHHGIGDELWAMAQNPLIWTGLMLYGFGAMIWLFVLGRAPLSLAYPFVGLGFIMTMAAGALFFNESLSIERISGTLLIIMGCILVARSA